MFKDFWNYYGFNDLGDFVSSALMNKSLASIGMQTVGAGLTVYVSFIEAHVFKPPSAVLVISALLVIDSILGAAIAINQGQKFSVPKFSRIVLIWLAHMIILVASYQMQKVDPFTFSWLPNAAFGFFATRTLLSIIRNFVALKLIKGELIAFLESKLSTSVDEAIQKNKDKSTSGVQGGDAITGNQNTKTDDNL